MATATSQAERVSSDRNVGVMFVISQLDDYGLDPYEFRVYGHITRRTGGRIDGQAFASIKKMAEMCKMSPRKLQYALKVLCTAGLLIKEEDSHRRTNIYKLTRQKDWVDKAQLESIREKVKSSST
jgi:DNA-binding MarR family transcriptional regulator